ncbi:hypothetical protein Cenrod_0476 [Candidatus Symbiobacter mobilis CR]|uniref:Uncharacterized protein n=1 Tax=Candidatus Symbiobacter mobilis CR TaxID=946483 RepID=U5N502_9BURK|nr:hypothetical protein Cenrod_0476 [Candidatus Symbiobacter mobilis CR]
MFGQEISTSPRRLFTTARFCWVIERAQTTIPSGIYCDIVSDRKRENHAKSTGYATFGGLKIEPLSCDFHEIMHKMPHYTPIFSF